MFLANAALTVTWEVPAVIGGAIATLGGLIVFLVKHFSKKEDEHTDRQQKNMETMMDIVSKNTEAHTKLTSSIDVNTKITERSADKIEQLYIKAMTKNGG